jgi:hypothetical protein
MDKKAQLEIMRREHRRESAEARDNEMYIRDGEDQRIQMIRVKMERILRDTEITAERRKELLANQKNEIELLLDERNEREHDFIAQELRRHQLEQELEQEIVRSEKKEKIKKNVLFHPRTTLTVGAEQIRKNIEENRLVLSEEEQFSTILINNSERENIPEFAKNRRKKEPPPPDQSARIDTIVIKQREIGMMYRESRELQESLLKPKKPLPETTEENE